MVRTKFKVNGITQFEGGSFAVSMSPVTSGSEENKNFFKWTPSGSLDLRTVNEEAVKAFEVGAEYYLDFTKSE